MGYEITSKDSYDTDSNQRSIEQIIEQYLKTFLDGSFQRYGGLDNGSGWGKKQSSEFIGNLIAGKAIGTRIIVARVADCLQWAIAQKSQEDIEYFQGVLNEGYEEISIDGNNTASAIYGFVEGKIPALIPDAHTRSKLHKKHFKDLDAQQQYHVRHFQQVTKLELRKISKVDMCDEFRNVNRAVPLNDQEWRQARSTDLTATIREISNVSTIRDGFLFVFKKLTSYDRRTHEQMTAQLCIKHDKSFDTSLMKKALDDYYKENNSVDSNTQKTVRNILKEVKKCRDAVLNKNQIKTGLWHNLCDVIYLVDEYGLQIDDYEEFMEWFLAKDAEYNAYAETVIEKEKEEKSYIHWTTTYGDQKFYRKTAVLFGSHLYKEKEKLINNGALSEKPKIRTSKDSFTFKDKLRLWNLQGGKTRDGDVIDILDLYKGGKYETDHRISVANGGETTIENAELMTTKENRKKGSKDNEPHFDFQKQEEVVSRQVAE